MGSRDLPPRNSADDEDDFNPRFAQMRMDGLYPLQDGFGGYQQEFPGYPQARETMFHTQQRAPASPINGPVYEYAYGSTPIPPPAPGWTRHSLAGPSIGWAPNVQPYPHTSFQSTMKGATMTGRDVSSIGAAVVSGNEWPGGTGGITPVPSWRNRQNRLSWSGGRLQDGEKERRAYHPQAPAKRSDWVMWVGNVPPNTLHEELWRYFNSNVPPPLPSDPHPPPWKGPSSIFLISRSSCAFVNLSSQSDLDRAVAHFNGQSLRSWDARCPRMVCRIRKRDDDLRSGVGAQRGTGMHTEWIRSQTANLRSPLDISVPPSPAVLQHPPEGEGRRRESVVRPSSGHRSSNSFASTNSSLLLRHFPRRFFILKSATQAELDDAGRTSIWRTQRHNEPILDQAYRTATEVILIFGANKSGEFFGCARMVEPIDKERAARRAVLSSVSASSGAASEAGGSGTRKDLMGGRATDVAAVPASELAVGGSGLVAGGLDQQSVPVPSSNTTTQERARADTDPIRLKGTSPGASGTALRTASPSEITPGNEEPPSLPHRSASDPKDASVSSKHSIVSAPATFPQVRRDSESDVRLPMKSSTRTQELGSDGVLRKDTVLSPGEKASLGLVSLGKEKVDALEGNEDGRGLPFRVEWLYRVSLPFSRTRNLRNPWNNDREVKISRDGTEVEPGVGAQLIAEWDISASNISAASPRSGSPSVPISALPQSSSTGSL